MNSSDSKAREAFEAIASEGGKFPGAIRRGADGEYTNPITAPCWKYFQSALQWAASQQAAEGDMRRDADRWRQLAYMETRMVAPQVMRDYIARPEWLDKASALRAQYGDVASTQGGADEQR